MTEAETLLKGVAAEHVIADKGYDSDALRQTIRSQGGRPVIPSRQGHRYRRHDAERYKLRNVVERFINRLKHFRRVATRYEKHAENFFGFVCLASLKMTL
jgi:transposase